MGSLVLMMALQSVIAVICTLILRKNKGKNSKFLTFIKKTKDNLVWNGIIRMIHENYIMFTICVLINWKRGDWGKNMIINNVFALIFTVCMWVYPVALSIYTWKNFDELVDEESDLAKKCGAHMKMFHKTRNGKCMVWFAKFRYYPKVFTMCVISVFCQDLPGIQIIFAAYIALFEMIFVGLVRPNLTAK